MPQETILADYRGGMNALAAVDKLAPNECLLAENVRLDETGNVQSAGAFTHQNSSPYADSSGTTTVHSLYWNPLLGAVAGVGKDVFQGLSLGSMTSVLVGTNTNSQKMSFASAPNRVYFDVGSVGYWSDLTNLLTVDWPPPVAVGATSTTKTVGTGTQTGSATNMVAWTNPNNVTSTTTAALATVALKQGGSNESEFLIAAMSTNSFAISTAAVSGITVTFIMEETGAQALGGNIQAFIMKNNVPVGASRSITLNTSTPLGVFNTYTLGNSSDLWGTTWSQSEINSGGFGFQLVFVTSSGAATVSLYNGQITVSQGSGFVAGTGAAGTLTGTYTYKVTFVAANGEESDGSNDSNSVVLSAQQGSLTSIQTGDARTVARNIYRKGGALTAHYLVGTIQNNSDTTFSDNYTDTAALTAGVILAGDVPGDYANTRLLGGQFGTWFKNQVRFPALHYDRIFWVIPGTNYIIWSKPLNGFAYPAINFISVGDSKPVTRILSIYGELIIEKADSIWRLTGNDEASFDLTQTPSAVGTDESFTVVALPDKMFFCNRWGPWLFNGYTSQPLTPKLDLWWRQEDRTGKSLFGANGFHPIEITSATTPLNFDAVGNSDKYYVAYAESGQARNNAVLRFDMKYGNITKRPVTALSLAIDPVNGFVYMGDASGFVSLLDDFNGTNGGGASVNFDFQSGYIDVARGSNKALWALEFYLNTGGQALTPSVYYDNGLANETLGAITTTGLQRVVRTMEATVARKMQNFSWRLNGALTQVNSAGTPQVQIVHVKALYDVRVGRARTGQ